MEIVASGPGFAAELRGVTIADVAASPDVYAQVRAAFEEHSVLVFRDQHVSDEAQLAFSRRFGPLGVTKVGAVGHGSHLVVLKTLDDDGNVVPADHRLALENKANQLWHTDSSFKRVPALASVLSSRIVPGRGGETEYVSTRIAFERLDPGLRERVSNSFAWHEYAYSRGKIAPDLARPEERAALPPQCWRLVWRNPVNGRKALYLASHAYGIEGMEPAAARELLAALTEAAGNHASRPAVAGAPAALHGAQHHRGDRRRRAGGHVSAVACRSPMKQLGCGRRPAVSARPDASVEPQAALPPPTEQCVGPRRPGTAEPPNPLVDFTFQRWPPARNADVAHLAARIAAGPRRDDACPATNPGPGARRPGARLNESGISAEARRSLPNNNDPPPL